MEVTVGESKYHKYASAGSLVGGMDSVCCVVIIGSCIFSLFAYKTKNKLFMLIAFIACGASVFCCLLIIISLTVTGDKPLGAKCAELMVKIHIEGKNKGMSTGKESIIVDFCGAVSGLLGAVGVAACFLTLQFLAGIFLVLCGKMEGGD